MISSINLTKVLFYFLYLLRFQKQTTGLGLREFQIGAVSFANKMKLAVKDNEA